MVLFYKSSVLFCKSSVLFYKSRVLFYNQRVLFFKSRVLFYKSRTDLMRFASIHFIFPCLKGVLYRLQTRLSMRILTSLNCYFVARSVRGICSLNTHIHWRSQWLIFYILYPASLGNICYSTNPGCYAINPGCYSTNPGCYSINPGFYSTNPKPIHFASIHFSFACGLKGV